MCSVQAGDLTTGYSFSSGEQNVTHTKLNNAVNNATINTSFLTGKPAVTSLNDDDLFLLYSSSDLAWRKISAADLLLNNSTLITGQTLDSAPSTADYALTYDVSAGAMKKVLLSSWPFATTAQQATNGSPISDTDHSPFYDRSIGVADSLSNLLVTANTTNRLNFLWLGDSEGAMSYYTIKHRLRATMVDGIETASLKVGELDWYPDVSSETASIFDVWWQQGGLYQHTNGAFRTWAVNGSGYATGNLAFVWYPLLETNGWITLQSSPDGSAWTTRLAVNASNSTVRTMAYTNIALPLGGYKLRTIYTNTSAPYCFDLWAGIENTNGTAARISACNAGGSTVQNFLSMGTNTIRLLLTNVNPTVIFYQQYKPLSSQTNGQWEAMRYLFSTYAPGASVIMPSFNASDPTNAATVGAPDALLRLAVDVCKSNGWGFVDLFSRSSYSNAANYGLPSDNIHWYTDAGFRWTGDRVAAAIDLTGVINAHNRSISSNALGAAIAALPSPLTNNWNNGPLKVRTNVYFNALGNDVLIGGIPTFESTYSAIWFAASAIGAPSFNNLTLGGYPGASWVNVDSGGNVSLRVANVTQISATSSGVTWPVVDYSLTADNTTIDASLQYAVFTLHSDSAVAANRTFALTTGINGKILHLTWTGTNAGELIDDSANVGSGNVRLNGTWTPTQYDTLTLLGVGNDWHEIARSAN